MKLFGQHVYPPILLLAAAEYTLAAGAVMLAAALLVGGGLDVSSGNLSDITPWGFVFSTAVVVGLTAMGLYQPKQRLTAEGIVLRLLLALGLAVAVLAVIAIFFPVAHDVRLWGLSFVLSVALLGSARLVFGRLVDHDAFRRKVLVYGAGERAASLLRLRRRSDQRGFQIAAFVPAPGDRRRLDDPRVHNTSSSLLDLVREFNVDEIVVAVDERRAGLPIRDLLECKLSGIAVIDLLNFLERETGKVKVDLLNPGWLIFNEGFAGKPTRGSASRALDLIVSALLTVFALPIMAIIALAILIEDGRPILYCQQRVGYRGRCFPLYKFRSMIKDAEVAGQPQWAAAHDPRVTRVGRVIRKLRFDELPQLFNVFRGDMSLVGPRPERPEFVERLSQKIPYYHERHSVKPGVTGWAQLCYSYGSSDEDALEKLEYDLYYVKHRSLAFDLVLILQTVEVVLWGKGSR